MEGVAAGYSNLEFDLATGRRGSRYHHCASLIAELTGAEDGLVVNNCAGGLVLALAALARDRDVVVSRGEMVEIGGGFRIPEVLEQAGARLREVGATNRTRASDYESALRAGGVAAILKVHRSNFRISGFTEEAELTELAALGRAHRVPVIHDLGSGLMVEAARLGLPPEPTPAQSVQTGADLVIFSGDKLLGGPQAGLIAGTRELVARLKRTPLCRALRVDKGTLAALEATLRLYRDEDRALAEIPALRMLAAGLDELENRAHALAEGLDGAIEAAVVRGHGRVGGGTYPEHPVPSVLLRLDPGALGAETLARRLRSGDPPVVGRVEEGAVLLDLRSVLPEQDRLLGVRIRQAVGGTGA
jgi:L-seryl-tRNA(Ser) seleniumtransferase